MRCPLCDQETALREVGEARVDVCESCKGMFLDHGELNKVAEPIAGDLEYSTLDHESFQHEDSHGPIACPSCLTDARTVEMKKVEFNIYTGIILDFCPRCRGFWLDGQELDRINDEVRKLQEASREVHEPPMMWFARFCWSIIH